MKSLWPSMKFQALTPRLKVAPNVVADELQYAAPSPLQPEPSVNVAYCLLDPRVRQRIRKPNNIARRHQGER